MLFNFLFVAYWTVAIIATYKMYAFLTNHMVDQDVDFYDGFVDPAEDPDVMEKEKWDNLNDDLASGLNLNGC